MGKYIQNNAYWVKHDGSSCMTTYRGSDFWMEEDRYIEDDDEQIEEVIHVPFPEGWEKEVY